MLRLGPVDERDTTWFNGTRVGGLDDRNAPREYKVPGVAVNSKGHVFVFTRSNSAGGPAFAPTAATEAAMPSIT